jgi:prophage regulatory protein
VAFLIFGSLDANKKGAMPRRRKKRYRLLTRQDLITAKGISFSNTHLYRLIARGDFPKPFKLSKRKNFWDEATIDAWIAARAAA